MKIRPISDIHLESNPNFYLDPVSDTIIIIAGDLAVGTGGMDFIEECSDNYQHVIYVLGNHEFYHNNISKLIPKLKYKIELINQKYDSPKVTLLENESIIINGIKFVGATLWTDYKKGNEGIMRRASTVLNDHSLINKEMGGISAKELYNLHKQTMEYFEEEVDSNTVVITHHLPSFQTIPIRYRITSSNNYYFTSNLDEFILRKQPKLWIAGHTHDFTKVKIGKTRIIVNPIGYTDETSSFREDLIVELSKKDASLKSNFYE